MQFDEWYNKQWIPIYYDRIHKVEDVAGDAKVNADVANKRYRGLRIKLERALTRIFGNGVPGFVRDEIAASLQKFEDTLAIKIKLAVTEALDERESAIQSREGKLQDRRIMRAWDIVKMIYGTVQAVALSYIAWKYFK